MIPFKCCTWLLKPKENRDPKFDPILWKGLLVQYANKFNAYIIFQNEYRKFFFKKNAQFNKHIFIPYVHINRSIKRLTEQAAKLSLLKQEAILSFDNEDTLLSQEEPPFLEQNTRQEQQK